MNAASPIRGTTIGEEDEDKSLKRQFRDRRNDHVLSNVKCAGSADQRLTRARRLL